MPLAEVSVAVSKGVGYHVVRHLDTSLMAETREVTVQAVAQPAVRVPEQRVRKLALDKHLRTDGRAHSVGELRTDDHDNAVVLASVLRAICRSQG